MALITTPNPEICVAAVNNAEYQKILQTADLSVPDGWGILWAADYQHQKKRRGKKNWFLEKIFFSYSLIKFMIQRRSIFFPERVSGADLFCQFCQQSSAPIFLLGGTPGVAAATADFFQKQGANIVGTDAGQSTREDDARIVKKINDSGAQVLFVAFGAPAQEKWLDRNHESLKNIGFGMGIGGSFDFIVGKQKRAPLIFQKLGMEWFWRLIREPQRWQRIWTAVWKFPKKIDK